MKNSFSSVIRKSPFRQNAQGHDAELVLSWFTYQIAWKSFSDRADLLDPECKSLHSQCNGMTSATLGHWGMSETQRIQQCIFDAPLPTNFTSKWQKNKQKQSEICCFPLLGQLPLQSRKKQSAFENRQAWAHWFFRGHIIVQKNSLLKLERKKWIILHDLEYMFFGV